MAHASGNLVVSATQKAKAFAAAFAAAHNNEELGDFENSTTVANPSVAKSSPVPNLLW